MNPEYAKNQRATDSIAAQLKQEWLATGMTAVEWEQREQIGKIEAKLLASGREIEDINKEWETKSTEQILKEYSNLPEVQEVGKTVLVPIETDWLAVCFAEFVPMPTPKMLFRATLTLRGGMVQEYEQETLVCSQKLSAQVANLKRGECIEIRLRMHFGDEVPCTLIELRKHQLQSKPLSAI